ncbi:MAG: efflux RND transporter periplasmic adaptor subunit, partial [Archangium sp.]
MSRKFSRPGGALEPSALLVTLLLVASPGCSRENTQAAVPAPRYQSDGSVHLSSKEREALGLAVAPATKGHLPYVALRYGRVQARPGGDAVVVAPVTARVAEPARVQPGATVAAGAVLLEVEPQLAASERISLGVQGEELAGQIESTRRELETLKAEAARAKELAQASFLSTEKLQQAETSVTTTQARLSALLRAQEVQVQGRTHRMAVRAPVAGTVVSLTVPPLGAVVQPGDELARLVTPGPHWVEVLMPPEEPVADSYEVA